MISQSNPGLRKQIFAIALPIMVQNIVQHLMILTDRAFLGNLNARYLSAIGNVLIPYNALTFFFFSAATGLTVLIAQNVGKGDYEKAKSYSQSSFFFATLFSAGMFLLWHLWAKEILMLFGAKGLILKDAVTYVRIISISLLFLGIETTVYSLLQGVGATRPSMVFGIVKSLLNVFLDWVMVFGKLGFPAMGLEGAALATLVSNIIGALGIFLAILLYKKLTFPVRLSKRALLRPKWQLYWEALKIGLPSGFESILWYTGQLVLVWLMNRIDPMAIGVYTTVNGIQGIALLIYNGYARAATTLVGQSWGRKDYTSAREIGFYSQRLAGWVTLTFAAVFLLFPQALISIFTKDAAMIQQSAALLRMAAVFINVQMVNVVMGSAIRGTGDTMWMCCSQIFGTVFVVGVSIYLMLGLSWGLVGMYLTMILDEGLRGWINLLRFSYGVNPFKKWLGWTAAPAGK